MTCPTTVKKLLDGRWLARSVNEVGVVEVTGASRDEALKALRDEIRYRLEWCPCSGVSGDYVKLDVREERDAAWRGTVF